MTIKQFEDIDPSQLNKFHFTGILTLKPIKTELNYGLYNSSNVVNNSISDFLRKVYISPSPQLKISIVNLDNNHRIEKEGELLLQKDQFNVYDYSINEYPLGLELFNLVDARLEVHIEHLTENSEAENQDGQS